MLKAEYEKMFNMEEKHWWYVGMHRIFFTLLEKYLRERGSINTRLKILDAGCGTGLVMKRLERYGLPVGVDFSETALKFCKGRGLKALFQGSIVKLDFPDNSYDVITCFDVLYHLNVEDDALALKELYRVCKPGGVILINVPAWEFLKSTHDIAIQTKKRYRRSELRNKIERAGFSIKKITYLNVLMFPLALIIRIMKKLFRFNDANESDVKMPNPALNNILAKILFFEAVLLQYIDFALGLSVFCVAEK